MVLGAAKGLVTWFKTFISLNEESGYLVGGLAWELIFNALSAGAASALTNVKFVSRLITIIKDAKGKIVGNMKNLVAGMMHKMDKVLEGTPKWFKFCISGKGCFVKGTPVLIARNRTVFGKSQNEGPQATFERDMRGHKVFGFRNAAKGLAVAAAMPLVSVPIQEVQLLDYAVAHTSVNSGYGITASTDDTYMGLFDKDPYTSDQQRTRDKYELNDTDWNEVVFEDDRLFRQESSDNTGYSSCKMALHTDWIKKKGYYVGAVVNLDLPEQGISGPFKITSIKHIIPQKKPVDEDETDDYGYKPVTALFNHQSDAVYNITFDDRETIGVTYQHPIFSVTAGDWRLAGELEVGEKVLTKEGEATVTNTEKKGGSELVYNLEVKDFHNFLVGNEGVVVHNSCWDIVKAVKKMTPKQLKQHIQDGWDLVIKSSADVVPFFNSRRYFQDLMQEFRYVKEGLKSTNPIATNFKALDAFKETSRKVINGITEITSSLAVSMKTTKVKEVTSWLSSNSNHLDDLVNGLSEGIQWNGHHIKYTKVRLDIYMPKNIYTPTKATQWKNHLKNLYPDIEFDISTLEKYLL